MHVIGVRSDLNEFFHIHPNPTLAPGVLSLFYTFQKPGSYKLWSEVKKDGIIHAFGHPQIMVEGEGVKEEKRVSFGRNTMRGDYQIALRIIEPVVAGHEHDLLFDVHTLNSYAVELEDYLGEKMHLAIIKDDLKQFIHTHPESVIPHNQNHQGFLNFISITKANGGGHNTAKGDHGVNFPVTFPEAGLYKVFAQFRPTGIGLSANEALVASFWISVEERAPLISAWWGLLLASLIIMGLLSWGVSRFIKVS